MLEKAIERQAAILGCMVADPMCISDLALKLDTRMFLTQPLKELWDCFLSLNDKGVEKFDLFVVRDKMGSRWNDIGGTAYFKKIADLEYSAFNAERYAEGIVEFHRKTQLLELSKQVTAIITSDKTSDEIIADIEKAMSDIDNSSKKIEMQHIKDVPVSFECDGTKYFATQFPALNDQIIGLGKGKLIIVCGSTGMGKTSLMLDFFRFLSYENKVPAAYFSCEMSNQENKERLACTISEISYAATMKGYVSSEQKERLYEAARQVGERPMYLDKTPSLNPITLKRKLARAQRVNGIEIAFVDHLHNMTAGKRIESKRQELAYISKAIGDIATELDLPIILGAQVNRSCATRDNKRPGMHDLRDCGEIEEAADIILNVFRPSYYDEDGTDEIRVLKGRNCGTGHIDVEFIGKITSFRPL